MSGTWLASLPVPLSPKKRGGWKESPFSYVNCNQRDFGTTEEEGKGFTAALCVWFDPFPFFGLGKTDTPSWQMDRFFPSGSSPRYYSPMPVRSPFRNFNA